ncbi:hypothetical protein NMK54_20760 [Nocardia otitidiscaviarum]|uniref:hypothetical protein n=1 Tax=Nocardia otitidiscaviarum TaxID=1823 RepID=UPI001FCFF960|nr:hypothetical protein [Nocardia otitidiscaviarum]MCP9622583.1 hypothetical protein [Nocardia otitidiscaviarum]
MTDDSNQLSVAELLARNGQQGSSASGGGGRRRRSGRGISVADLTGDMPQVREGSSSHAAPDDEIGADGAAASASMESDFSNFSNYPDYSNYSLDTPAQESNFGYSSGSEQENSPLSGPISYYDPLAPTETPDESAQSSGYDWNSPGQLDWPPTETPGTNGYGASGRTPGGRRARREAAEANGYGDAGESNGYDANGSSYGANGHGANGNGYGAQHIGGLDGAERPKSGRRRKPDPLDDLESEASDTAGQREFGAPGAGARGFGESGANGYGFGDAGARGFGESEIRGFGEPGARGFGEPGARGFGEPGAREFGEPGIGSRGFGDPGTGGYGESGARGFGEPGAGGRGFGEPGPDAHGFGDPGAGGRRFGEPGPRGFGEPPAEPGARGFGEDAVPSGAAGTPATETGGRRRRRFDPDDETTEVRPFRGAPAAAALPSWGAQEPEALPREGAPPMSRSARRHAEERRADARPEAEAWDDDEPDEPAPRGDRSGAGKLPAWSARRRQVTDPTPQSDDRAAAWSLASQDQQLVSGETVAGDLLRDARDRDDEPGPRRSRRSGERSFGKGAFGRKSRAAEPDDMYDGATEVYSPLRDDDDIEDDARSSVVARVTAVANRARRSRTPRKSDEEENRRQWLILGGQSTAAAVAGMLLFKGFERMWEMLPWVALALAMIVILGLVALVRVLRRTDDIFSTVIAVVVGVFVTLGPLAFLLSTS